LQGSVSAQARALLRHRLKSINKNADEELHDEEGSNNDNGKEEEACLGEVICDWSTACEAQKPTNNYYTKKLQKYLVPREMRGVRRETVWVKI
jgi:hypothetical protein